MPMNVGGFGKEKDWAQVKPGDRMEFEAIYPKPENKNPDGDLIQKRVGKIVSVSSLEVLLIVIPISEIAPSLSEQEYREMINSFDGYPERMEKFGVWAFELLPIEEEYNE
jgi:ASC-1-like (ASCH) protein